MAISDLRVRESGVRALGDTPYRARPLRVRKRAACGAHSHDNHKPHHRCHGHPQYHCREYCKAGLAAWQRGHLHCAAGCGMACEAWCGASGCHQPTSRTPPTALTAAQQASPIPLDLCLVVQQQDGSDKDDDHLQAGSMGQSLGRRRCHQAACRAHQPLTSATETAMFA